MNRLWVLLKSGGAEKGSVGEMVARYTAALVAGLVFYWLRFHTGG